MADNKKEQERAELHRTICGIANDLRGSVDGWDFIWSKRTQEKLLILPSSTQKIEEIVAREQILRDEISAIIADIEVTQ